MLATAFAALTTIPLVAAPQQEPQAFVPLPPGPPPATFCRDVVVDGDVALVLSTDTPATVWSYERSGLDWLPTEPLPLPPLPQGQPDFIHLAGGRAFVADRIFTAGVGWAHQTHVFEQIAGTWIQTDLIPGFSVLALSPAGDVALGRVASFGIGVAELGPGGWQIVYDSAASGVTISGNDHAIGDDVAVIGNNTTLTCHPMWEGEVHVIERLAGGGWAYTQQIGDPLGCFESRLGSFVGVDDDQVLATARHGFSNIDATVLVFERTGGPGTWSFVEQLPTGTGAGLDVRDGFLLTGSTAAVRSPRAKLFRRTPAAWVEAASYEVEAWPTLAPGDPFAGPSGFPMALLLVDAPPRTGIGQRAGALVRQAVGTGDGLASFDPVVSATTCPATPNSSGLAAELSVVGSDVIADQRASLIVESLPASTVVLPLVSTTFGVVMNPAGSAGDLCVGLPAVRLLSLAGSSTAGGRFQARIDLGTLPFAPITPGTRLFFQTWFRDAGGTNFSSGAAIQMF